MEIAVDKEGSLLKWWEVWQTHKSCTIWEYISLNIEKPMRIDLYIYIWLLQLFIVLPCILLVFPAHFIVPLLYQITLVFIWIFLQIFTYFCWQIFITILFSCFYYFSSLCLCIFYFIYNNLYASLHYISSTFFTPFY